MVNSSDLIDTVFNSLMNPLEHKDPICPPFPHSSGNQVSACQKYFDHRYVIGIHEASEKIVKKFVSARDNYRMVSTST